MQVRISGFWAAMVAVALLAAGLPALVAAEDQEALLRQGIKLRREGKGQEALETFQRAAQIKETPRVLAQVGLAEQALGLWVHAEAHLKAALDAKGDAWIQKNRRALDEAFRTIQGHLGSLEIWGNPAGAEVTIDGQVSGALPSSGTLRLPIGEVKVTVRKDGYAEVTRVVRIAAGDLVRENVDLHAMPRAKVALQPQPLPATSRPGGALTNAQAAPPLLRQQNTAEATSDDVESPFYKRWWFWTLVGSAAIGAAAGTYFITHRGTTPSMQCDAQVPCGMF